MKPNVQCVKFNPCGEFLAATSIESTLQIFVIPEGDLLKKLKLNGWGWDIHWVIKENLENYDLYK